MVNADRFAVDTSAPDRPLLVSLADLDRSALPLAGGKAINLGELSRAGFPVPAGFCVTTVAYQLVADGADLGSLLAALAATSADDPAQLASLAEAVRSHLLAAPIPSAIATAIAEAYRMLSRDLVTPVAVRSSATAEDLPHASFAGQQDTYLNVVGADDVLDAVRRCWASLWTDRAVTYRARNGIDHHAVRLAVVVQRMVDAAVAGVLFTANPLTGRRRQAVVDASPGLGEAIVSGAVNPDHFVVDPTGELVERRLGDKRVAIRAAGGGGTQRIERADRQEEACLTDAQVRFLTEIGRRVETHYGAPQDVEWAIDAEGRIWLTQARPVTTLFPLPTNASLDDDDLRLYASFNVIQGVYRPFTPMGLQVFRLLGSALATAIGRPPSDPTAGPAILAEAAHRIFLDLTPAFRSAIGRRLLLRAAENVEARSAPIVQRLATDPRFAIVETSRWRTVVTLMRVLIRLRLPLRVGQALLWPTAARAEVGHVAADVYALAEVPLTADAAERLAAVERLFLAGVPRLGPRVASLAFTGMGAYAAAGALLGSLATDSERQIVLRGLPHNPTTEMDLALWQLAQQVRADPAVRRAIQGQPAEQLAQAFQAGALPSALQQGLVDFLHRYGHRGVAEIDLGLPRWSEDPTHILGVLANYLQLEDAKLSPDAQFRRAAREAESMVAVLTKRARTTGRIRGWLVQFLLSRTRALVGQRELPKFTIVKIMALARAHLWHVGDHLAKAGRLETAEDVFFTTLPEAKAALTGADLRAVVRQRRASYDWELKRRHVPRILLSDGTEPAAESAAAAPSDGALRGTPASAGVVTAKARVILDPTGARLEPGEILVAPSTDPGWTPLFLTASGLVMEMGGAMSHGAVVAREYGIPAVVGVPGATQRITTGQRITVDGAAGTVVAEDVGRPGS